MPMRFGGHANGARVRAARWFCPPYGVRRDDESKNGRDCPGHFHFANASPYLGGTVPGGGGGSEAVLPLSKGVMRRMVTRRLMRLGPSVCSLRYCEP